MTIQSMQRQMTEPSTSVESIYDELRALAARYMSRERTDHTLQPTALVHEAYLRLAKVDGAPSTSRAAFMACAATAIRRILIDHAKKRDALKRGGDRRRLMIETEHLPAPEASLDLLALHEQLDQLERMDRRMSRIVELRAFGGLTIAETADVLDVSTSTVERDWDFACSWLRTQIARGDSDED